MRRPDICLYLGPADRAELQVLIANRNTPRKLVWRVGIVLATAEGQGPALMWANLLVGLLARPWA